jgi:transcriptional regulator with PAS, ATPase and Fis domain
LETGEFIRVGSSKVQKTNVRVIAASNTDITVAVASGRFREDLFYRLNTVPVKIPALRERGEDMVLLFRKFAVDFAEKYRMPAVKLSPEARILLLGYQWPGNVRQLKNIAEQISIIETEREISAETLRNYLPDYSASNLPAVTNRQEERAFSSEREILYKILFDMKSDMTDLKKLVLDMLRSGSSSINISESGSRAIRNLFRDDQPGEYQVANGEISDEQEFQVRQTRTDIQDTEEVIEESLSLENKEVEMIIKALEKHSGKRKLAAKELGISERTLYRKIKLYGLDN